MALVSCLTVASLVAAARAAVIKPSLQGLSWKYDDADFWAPIHLNSAVYHAQSPVGAVPGSLSRRDATSGGHLGCTVITIDGTVDSLSSLTAGKALAGFHADDVWSADQFLDCLFVQYDGLAERQSVPMDPSFAEFLAEHRIETAMVAAAFDLEGFASASDVISVDSSCDLTNGPYVANLSPCDHGCNLSMTPAYRLHGDLYDAFMFGSYPDATEPARHQALHVSLPGSRLPSVVVPSRLSSTRAGAGPLAGLRYAVKDIFHVKGLKTSGGSRAYYETYGYRESTTETVQICEDAGASLVGKVRTITFALGAPRNGMSVDFSDPWNARGDGYQTTEGSSSGSGAAVVGYDWVDFALGSDTGGSVRFPARAGGVYGYKPTHGVFDLTGVLPAIAEQDTPGFLARSPEIFTRVGRVWAEGKPLAPASSSLPRKLLRHEDHPEFTQPAAVAMIEAFFVDMARALDMSPDGTPSLSSVDITGSFLAANVSAMDPPQTPEKFLRHVYADHNDVQSWDGIGAALVKDYGSAPGRDGAFPPLEPPVNQSWTNGQDEAVRARYPESRRRREAFASWFNREVLPANEETCSEYLFAHSYHAPPNTVKTDPAQAVPVPGWWDGVYTNYAGTPEVVVPIGQIQYRSEYTKRIEWQPVTVALGMAKGCDLALFEVVDRLAEAGLLKEVMSGVLAYPVE